METIPENDSLYKKHKYNCCPDMVCYIIMIISIILMNCLAIFFIIELTTFIVNNMVKTFNIIVICFVSLMDIFILSTYIKYILKMIKVNKNNLIIQEIV